MDNTRILTSTGIGVLVTILALWIDNKTGNLFKTKPYSYSTGTDVSEQGNDQQNINSGILPEYTVENVSQSFLPPKSTEVEKVSPPAVSNKAEKVSPPTVPNKTEKVSPPAVSTEAEKVSLPPKSTEAEKVSPPPISTEAEKVSQQDVSQSVDKPVDNILPQPETRGGVGMVIDPLKINISYLPTR